LRDLPIELVVLLSYLVLSRAFIGDEARLGVKIGPIPVFVTDVALLTVIVISIRKRGSRLLNWTFSGGGAGAIGRAVWLLFLLALVYFSLAFREYGILAVRDLAVFSYSLFFPLTYLALGRRVFAVKLVRYFIYATCVGAAIYIFQVLSGLQLVELTKASKGLPGHQEVQHLSAGNLGAALSTALTGLFAYVAVERRHRVVNACAILLCLVALAQLLDRSAFIGFFLAAGMMFVLGFGRSRVYLAAFGASLFALLLLSAEGQLPVPGGAQLHELSQALFSGANFHDDPDGQFRLQRWQAAAQTWLASPYLGVGFGAPIIAEDTWTSTEIKRGSEQGKLGSFNQGMPHNTFLTTLVRTGPIGLGLIIFAWGFAVVRLLKVLSNRNTDSDQLAVLGILIAMIPYAALNLFFERPMLCAPFWIMLAVSFKLSESTSFVSAGIRRRIIPAEAVSRSQYVQIARAGNGS
jgi:O-antigen ligase